MTVSTTTMRRWWSSYRCLSSSQRKPIELFGRNAGVVAAPAYDGMLALEAALVATGYRDVKSVWIPRECPTGISGKTCQADGTSCSLHNYGIAVDIDPFGYGNPHFFKKFGDGWDFDDCKLTEDQVLAVEDIENKWGEQYFRWLGWPIGDTMHFELQVPPDRTEVNWLSTPGGAMAFSKGLTEEQWRILARMGVAGGGEEAVVNYWVKNVDANGNPIAPPTDQEHEAASANMFVTLAQQSPSDSYTKAQANARFQAKGDYALREHSHTGKVVETKEVTLS